MQLVPYIMFNGNCEEALNFYAQVFAGAKIDLMRFEGTPAEAMSEDKQKIMHADFTAKELSFMASDGGTGTQGGMVHLSLNFDDAAEQQKVFEALSREAKVSMPLQDVFWGAKFGMLTDRYGVNWMFNCEMK